MPKSKVEKLERIPASKKIPTGGAGHADAPETPAPDKVSLAHSAALLFAIVAASFASRMHIAPLFGRGYGPGWFYFGAVMSVVGGTMFVSGDAKKQSRILLTVVLLQTFSVLCGRMVSSSIAGIFDDPIIAAAVAHSLLSYPTFAFAGAVWLERAKTLTDPEATWWGQQIFRVFSSIALVTVVKILDPIMWETTLAFVDFSPRTLLLGTSIIIFSISMSLTYHESDRKSNNGLAVYIGVFSVIIFALARHVTGNGDIGFTPAQGIRVLYERYTPSGLVTVINVDGAQAKRYLRVDASVVSAISLDASGKVLSEERHLLDAVRFVSGSDGKRALVLGLQGGSLTASLITQEYNVTVIDPRRAVYDAAHTYFNLPAPAHAIFDDVPYWVSQAAKMGSQGPSLAEQENFDVIVHDLVEAGEIPARAFSMEFWEQLRTLLRERGVIAVRHVGRPKDVSLKSVVNMLNKNFGACKILHSNPQDPLSNPEKFSEFAFFCTTAKALNFRTDVFNIYGAHEISAEAILDGTSPERYLLRESEPIMNHWGRDAIGDHWRLMRAQYPSSLWSTY